MTTKAHDPDPEFVTRLESELVTELRRLERLGGPAPRRFDAGKWLRAAVWGAAGLLLGAASLTMAQRRRDFVAERLRAELDAIRRRTELLEPVVELEETRVRAGLAVPRSLNPLTIERARLDATAKRLRASLELRRTFVDGELTGAETELRHELLLATALELLRTENELLTQRAQAGVIPETEVYAAKQRLLEAEAETELAQIEIDLLEQELARLGSD